MFDSQVGQQLRLSIGRLWTHCRLLVARASLALPKYLAAGGLKESDRFTQACLQDGLQDIDHPLQGVHCEKFG